MRTSLILGLSFLLSPMLPAEDRLLDDGPPGFLHLQRGNWEYPEYINDIYLPVGKITAITTYRVKKSETEIFYRLNIFSQAIRPGGSEPLSFEMDFSKNEHAQGVALKITRLMNNTRE